MPKLLDYSLIKFRECFFSLLDVVFFLQGDMNIKQIYSVYNFCHIHKSEAKS